MKKIFTLLVACLCMLLTGHAQPITQQITLRIAQPGTLHSLITETYRPIITNLKLIGKLNKNDVDIIHEMTNTGTLEHLDLSEVEFVSTPNTGLSWDYDIEKGIVTDCGGGKSLKSIKLAPFYSYNLTLYGCENLTTVDIPECVKSLVGTFADCTNLTTVNFAKTPPTFDFSLAGAFVGCTSLTSIDIPQYVTSLEYTFANCTNLTTVNILGENPLHITDPEEGFDGGTFENCPKLQSIRFFSSIPLTPPSRTYLGIKTPITVYVPKGAYMAYLVSVWGSFKIVEFDATGIDTPLRHDGNEQPELYSIEGKRLIAPQRGLNLIRQADGTTKKVYIK